MTTASENDQVRSMLEVLEIILAGLDKDQRDKILAWCDDEMQTHAVVEYCQDANVAAFTVAADGDQAAYESGGPLVWRLGQPNPLDSAAVVFAMFHWDQASVVAAFSYKEQDMGDGKTAHFFFRTLICKPVHIHGPVHHFALVTEIGEFIGAGDDGEPVGAPAAASHANGGAAA